MRARLRLSMLVTLALIGCRYEIVEGPAADASSTGAETGDGCIVGSRGCACTPGGGCDPGLECDQDVCVEPDDPTETGPVECTQLGCDCESDEDCDEELICMAGECAPNLCGNGQLDPDEDCDDANPFDGDGCDNDCTRTQLLQIELGGLHTCVLIEGGRIRCWGSNTAGQIGVGSTDNVGDDETPAQIPDLPLPAAVEIAAGGAHTCARFESGSVRCWGFNTSGQLGYGNSFVIQAIGDDETIEGLPAVDLVAPVNEVDAGVVQTCVRLSGQLRCWGAGAFGQLGTGSSLNVGDDELPLDVPAVVLGGEPVNLGIGGSHGCAILASGGVRCWGRADDGQLGYGNPWPIGDNEAPEVAGDVPMPPIGVPPEASVVDIGGGLAHTCALFSTGDVVCWGSSAVGQLGQGNGASWGSGPGQFPSALAPVSLGGVATKLAVGYQHNCAVLEGGEVRCWGAADGGQLGQGNENPIGLFDVPSAHDPVELGGRVRAIAAGGAHTCAVFEDERLICWGSNNFGQLGYGYDHNVGDDELPVVAGPVDLL